MRKILLLASILLANLTFFTSKVSAAMRDDVQLMLADTLSLTIENATFNCTSDSISLRIRATGFTNIQSLRFSVAWKKARFRYSSAFISTPFETVSLDASDAVVSGTMGVRIDNTAPRTFPANTAVMVINLRVLDHSFAMDTLAFGDSPTGIKASNGLVLQPVKTQAGILKFIDTQAPDIIGCNDVLERTQGNTCGAMVSWTAPTAIDICDKKPTLIADKVIGTFFPIGTTKVTYSAKDFSGNTKTCSFNVTVIDKKPPLIENRPVDIHVILKSKTTCDTTVAWPPPTIQDACDGTDITITKTHASGAKFALGTTLVKYIATDKSGNQDSCVFKVTVTDTVKPTLTCPTATAEVTTAGVVMVGKDSIITKATPIDCKRMTIKLKDVAVKDNCVGWTLTREAPTAVKDTVFAVGNHKISYKVIDASANEAICIINLKVTSSDTLNKVNIMVSPTTICENSGNLVFTADSIVGAAYNWVGPNGFSSNKRIATLKNPDLLNGGLYRVSAILAAGCLARGEKEVTILQKSKIKAAVGALKCDNGTESLPLIATNLSADIPIFRWEWSGPDGFSTIQQNPTIQNITSKGNGMYQLTAYTASGCITKDSIKVAAGTDLRPKLKLSSNSPICSGADIRLSADTLANANYAWTGPNKFTSTDQIPLIRSATAFRNGVYSMVATYGNGCKTQVSTIRIEVLSPPKVKGEAIKGDLEKTIERIEVLANDTLQIDAKVTLSIVKTPNYGAITNNNNGTFKYIPKTNFVGFDEFGYKVCYDACPTACGIGVVGITISDPDNQCRVPDIITPNGDQYNDELVILCIGTAQYPNNELTILNEWGDVVFTASPYKNDWKGTYSGKPLPDGTYFYIFKEDRRDARVGTKTGAVTIFR
jgi:gliding motility-associated-like protein